MARQFAWLIDFEGRPNLKFWTGRGTLAYEGENYFGSAQALKIGSFQSAAGQLTDRNHVELFFGEDTATRQALINDEGPLPLRVTAITSADAGATWEALGIQFSGLLSAPSFDASGVYRAEIETYTGNVDRGIPQYWADADQRARWRGDKCFEWAAQLERGGPDIRWPT